ncbi:MFS transporter [Microbispora sp. CA-135349]|uniref:MFS transporter n=1 Tax=Microbispora sp. CA-135349 TaxID=3239953 RepID=UPI003D9016B0
MRPNRWWMLGAVSMATFMLLLDVTVVNVALPDIQRTLHATFFDLAWVIDAYALTLAAFLLTAGSLADRLGRRRIFVAGLALFTAASLLCGLAGAPLVLNVARAFQGVGGAVMYAVAPALIANAFHGRERGIAFGVSGGVTGLAVAVGPLIGGALTEVSWRWVFLLNVPIGLAVALVMLTRAEESRAAGGRIDWRGIDWPGAALLSSSLAMLVFALMRGAEAGWGSVLIVTLLAGAAVLLVAFVLVERARPEPMLDLGLFRNRSFAGLSLATVAVNAAVYAALLFMVLYLQNTLHHTSFETGLRFLPFTLVLFVAAAVTGTFAARIPAALLIGGGSLAVGAGFLVTGVETGSPWTALLPGMLLAGLGMGLFNPARAATAVDLVPLSRAGMSSGVSETFQQGGVALGIAALAKAGTAGPVAGVNAVMNVAGWIAVVGAVFGLALIRRRDFHQAATETDQQPDAYLERRP